jgi:hypothetical protein
MKKYVIEYSTGMYDSHCEHIYTMEAESETDIQLWILAAIEQWKLVSAEFRKLNNDPLRQSDILKWHEKYQEFIANNNVWGLDVNGYQIALPEDELNQDFDHLTMFYITELDEWFENNIPNRSMKNE